MNYRHAYHAGSLDDVFKHIVEIELIHAMQMKQSPFFFLDTHAGRGLYDLHGDQAQKNKKAEQGITALLSASARADWPASMLVYAKLIDELNPSPVEELPYPRFYMGSAWIAASLLRSQDRFAACEYHPEEHQQLKYNLRRLMHHAAHHRNGLEAMGALLPPQEKRALVFIDPPYEQPNEVNDIQQALKSALHKFPQGVYALWYPIKLDHPVEKLLSVLLSIAPHSVHQVQYVSQFDDNRQKLLGSGLLVINPPWVYQNNIQNTINRLINTLKLLKSCRVDCCLLK